MLMIIHLTHLIYIYTQSFQVRNLYTCLLTWFEENKMKPDDVKKKKKLLDVKFYLFLLKVTLQISVKKQVKNYILEQE